MDFAFQEVDSIDKVPEQFRGIYQEDEGKFIVGDQFKGVVQSVTGLTQALTAARKNVKEVDLNVLSEFGSTTEEIKSNVTAKISELNDQLEKVNKTKPDLERIRQDMADAHSKELQKQQVRTEALQSQLYSLLVENAATNAILEAKGSLKLIMPVIKDKAKVVEEDGVSNVYVLDDKGAVRHSAVTGLPLTIKDLILEMKNDEQYGRAFDSEAKNGDGMKPGSGRQSVSPDKSGLSSIDKIADALNKGQYSGARN